MTKVIYLTAMLFVLVYPVEIFDGFYLSHVWILLMTFLFFLNKSRIQKESLYLVLLMVSIFISDAISYIVFDGFPPYFFVELVKFVFLLLGVFVFSLFFQKCSLDGFFLLVSGFIVFYCFLFFVFSPNPYTYGGRFQIPDFGSSNTLALILSFSLIVLINYIVKRGARFSVRFLLVLFLVFAGFFLILMTESRGGLFSLVLGVLILMFPSWYKNWGKVLVLVTMIVSPFIFNSYLRNRFFDIGGNYSSGRVEIWRYLYDSLQSSFSGFLWGFGSGSVDFEFFDKIYNSAHSGLMTILYYYGFFVLLLFVYVFFKVVRGLLKNDCDQQLVKLALFFAFLITFVTDNLFLASQGTIYFSFFIGYVFSKVIDKPSPGNAHCIEVKGKYC